MVNDSNLIVAFLKNMYLCGMNNKAAIRRKKLYFEGLESAIAQPIPEALAKEIEAYINNLDDEEDQLLLRLWKENVPPNFEFFGKFGLTFLGILNK